MKKFSSISTSEQGFTLLEILIAITLLAFMTLAVVSITDDAASTKERTTEINENNLQIETAMARFEWDFSQIYSPLYFSQPMTTGQVDQNMDGFDDNTGAAINPAGGTAGMVSPDLQDYFQRQMLRFEQNEHFSGISKDGLPIPRFYSPEKSVFEFFTSSNRRKLENTRQSHYAWVRYALGDAPTENEDEAKEKNSKIPPSLKALVRYFATDDPYNPKRIDSIPEDRVKAAILLKNVENLEFHFWDYQRRKWETSLRTVRGGENQLRGVKMIITWYDSFGNKRIDQRTFRNLWPMVVPIDQVAPSTVPTGGAGAGVATSGAMNGGFR